MSLYCCICYKVGWVRLVIIRGISSFVSVTSIASSCISQFSVCKFHEPLDELMNLSIDRFGGEFITFYLFINVILHIFECELTIIQICVELHF